MSGDDVAVGVLRRLLQAGAVQLQAVDPELEFSQPEVGPDVAGWVVTDYPLHYPLTPAEFAALAALRDEGRS